MALAEHATSTDWWRAGSFYSGWWPACVELTTQWLMLGHLIEMIRVLRHHGTLLAHDLLICDGLNGCRGSRAVVGETKPRRVSTVPGRVASLIVRWLALRVREIGHETSRWRTGLEVRQQKVLLLLWCQTTRIVQAQVTEVLR